MFNQIDSQCLPAKPILCYVRIYLSYAIQFHLTFNATNGE